MNVVAALPPHPHDPLGDEEMEILERLARLEANQESLGDKIERNREEGKHDRNNLKASIEQLAAIVTTHNEKLSRLFSLLDQMIGAKKSLWTIGALLSFFGLAGIYQVAVWLGFVKGH